MDKVNPAMLYKSIYDMNIVTRQLEKSVGQHAMSINELRREALGSNIKAVLKYHFGGKGGVFCTPGGEGAGNGHWMVDDKKVKPGQEVYSLSFSVEKIPYTQHLENIGVDFSRFDGDEDAEHAFCHISGPAIYAVRKLVADDGISLIGEVKTTGDIYKLTLISVENKRVTILDSLTDIGFENPEDILMDFASEGSTSLATTAYPLVLKDGNPLYITETIMSGMFANAIKDTIDTDEDGEPDTDAYSVTLYNIPQAFRLSSTLGGALYGRSLSAPGKVGGYFVPMAGA